MIEILSGSNFLLHEQQLVPGAVKRCRKESVSPDISNVTDKVKEEVIRFRHHILYHKIFKIMMIIFQMLRQDR